MKKDFLLSFFAAILLIPAFAQTGPELLKLTLSGNSLSQPVSMTMGFSVNGNQAQDVLDTSSQIQSQTFTANDTTLSQDSVVVTNRTGITVFTMTSDSVIIDQFDARPDLDRTASFSLGISSRLADTITFTAAASWETDPLNASANKQISFVYLEEISTGIYYQVLGQNVTLPIPANSTFAMNYKLHVIAKPDLGTSPVTCFGDNNGSITMHNPFCSAWHYTIYDNGIPVASSSVSNPDTTLSSFTSQAYTVSVYINNMLADSESVTVNSPAQVTAQFTADTYTAFTNNPVSFLNGSSGASQYTWSFGDSSSDTAYNPSHSYLSTGDFAVTLTASNANGCSASFTDTIHVSTAPMAQGPHYSAFLYDPTLDPSVSADAALRGEDWHEPVLATSVQKITVTQQGEAQEMQVTILNVNGQLIQSVSTMDSTVEFDVPAAGIYLVMITSSNGKTISEKIMVN